MKKFIFTFLSLLLLFDNLYCQIINETGDPLKIITLLKNNTYEIKEFTRDSLLIYKGVLSSVDPEVRQGKFYFYDNKGKVIVTGLYKQDIPYGTWVYYDESYDTIRAINYSAVWNYLAKDALDYKIDTTVLKSLKKRDKETMNPDGSFYAVDKMPLFKSKDPFAEFNNYIYGNLIYPIYAARKGIGGHVKVQFIIGSEGEIRNPVIIDPVLSDLSIEAIRVLSESPTWEPGYQNNMPVYVEISWPISFEPWCHYSINPSLLEKDGKSENEKEEVYVIVEDMPRFRGGDSQTELLKFFKKNLHYPEKANEKGISGLVVVQFVIDSTGKILNPIVIASADPELDKEAVRVIMSSSPWEPGKQKGKPVSVLYTIPIRFVWGGDMEIKNF